MSATMPTMVHGRFTSPTQIVLPSAPPFGNSLSANACVTTTCAGQLASVALISVPGGVTTLASNGLPAANFRPNASKYFSVPRKTRAGTAEGCCSCCCDVPNGKPIIHHDCGGPLLVLAPMTPGNAF